MCMRPCGPVRNYCRQTREITKKEVLNLLQSNSYASIEIYENEEFVSEYTQGVSKLRTLLRKGDSSVHTTDNYRFNKYRKEGYRNIIVEFESNNQIVIIRQTI